MYEITFACLSFTHTVFVNFEYCPDNKDLIEAFTQEYEGGHITKKQLDLIVQDLQQIRFDLIYTEARKETLDSIITVSKIHHLEIDNSINMPYTIKADIYGKNDRVHITINAKQSLLLAELKNPIKLFSEIGCSDISITLGVDETTFNFVHDETKMSLIDTLNYVGRILCL